MIEITFWLFYLGGTIGYLREINRVGKQDKYKNEIGLMIFLVVIAPVWPLLFAMDAFRAASIYVEKNT